MLYTIDLHNTYIQDIENQFKDKNIIHIQWLVDTLIIVTE